MPNWRKSSFYIILCLITMVVLAGCGKEKSDEEKIQEQLEQAFKDAGIQLDTSSKSDEPPTVESELMEITNFLVGEIWNDGFVNIGHYAHSGTDATGQTIDIDFMIQQLGKAMEKKAEYDTYIQGLDSKYDEVKQLWTKVSGEIDTLYKKLQVNPPKANDEEYEFDTGLYQQYKEAFSDEVDSLNQ
ncbi:hypothetical protein H7F31_32225 [Paenibacillus sp. PAMC21692]|nr:hypothetical protein H7F31_32225 [Paenibacillus sp. PAMC21692]